MKRRDDRCRDKGLLDGRFLERSRQRIADVPALVPIGYTGRYETVRKYWVGT